MGTSDTAKKLLRDLLDAVVYDDAGTNDRFMYVWRRNWIPLKERIEAFLSEDEGDGNGDQ
jgi:hypothetical protein